MASEKIDRRQKRSKAAFAAAFRELLIEKEFSRITVKEIAERADKSTDGQSRVLGFIRIAVACVVTGVVITTVNTFILREVLAAWQGRAVLILLIPRVAEEVLSCILQAYIISLLFGIIYRGKLRQYINKIN